MSTRSHLDASIHAFGAELRSFVQRASDSITALKRTAEQRPQAGVQDFKECLEDLEQQVADYTDEIQQLAQYTADSISFEELIGHCSAVYSVNRTTALALEQHLAQYGYQRPPDAVLEPEGLLECLQDDSEVLCSEDFVVHTAQTRQANSLPASPVSKGSLAQLRGSLAGGHIPSRLGRSQPGSPIAAATADTLPGGAGDTMLLRDVAPLSTMRGLLAAGTASTAVPQTQLRQQSRVSLGSNTSSTPAGLLISPSVAALANKYATSSAGGSSVGLSLPEQQQFTGGPSTNTRPRRSPCRDLNLSYALADANSPDLPIFGRSTATTPPAATHPGATLQQQQQQTPVGPRCGSSIDEDSTGELYNSLIHSNMQGLGRRGPSGGGTSDLEVTPPCTRSGVSPCGSPQAPATAGRLPPTWVSEKMQQLDDLQADVTLTLSQMKRCPSRSRTTPAPADSDSDSEAGADIGDAPQPTQQQQQQQQLYTAGHVGSMHEQHHGRQKESLSTGERAVQNVGAVLPSTTAPAQHVVPHVASRDARTHSSAGDAQLPVARGSTAAAAARAKPYGSTAASLTAAAAAASADLESLMASLSMKYALGEDEPHTNGGDNNAATAMELDVEELPSPSSPCSAATAAAPAAAGGDSAGAGSNAHPVEPSGLGGSSSSMTPSVQQLAQQAVAAGQGGALTAGGLRLQSSIRRAQPTAEVHRLEEIPGFYPQQGGTEGAHLAPAAAAAAASTAGPTAAALPADQGISSSSAKDSSWRETAATAAAGLKQTEHAVLRPMQVQEHMTTALATADDAANAAAMGLRQSQQCGQHQQAKAKQRAASAPAQQQQQQAEALTPRAARLQRRLQQQQLVQQQQQQQELQEDTENTCPSKPAPAPDAAAAAPSAAAVVKAAAISAEEFSQLPGWCRSLLTVELLNGVLQQLAASTAGRCQAGLQEPGGFTAEDVALLGHSSSKSKTIVSCLHKLSRATLQRSATGGNVYRLV